VECGGGHGGGGAAGRGHGLSSMFALYLSIASPARHQSSSCALPHSRALRPRPRPLPARVQDSGGSEDLVDLDWMQNGGVD